MNKEGLTSNITYSAEDIGKALKIILKRLNEAKNEKTEISHICSTCKHRCTETYLTQDWMVERVWHNWCALDKKYMETENMVMVMANIFQSHVIIGKCRIIMNRIPLKIKRMENKYV